jgi:hypothetical protein
MSPTTQRLLRLALDGAHTLSVPIPKRSVVRNEVLVVDDDLGTREALTDLLQDRASGFWQLPFVLEPVVTLVSTHSSWRPRRLLLQGPEPV